MILRKSKSKSSYPGESLHCSRGVCDGTLTVGRKVGIAPLVIDVKANANQTGNCAQQPEVCVASEKVVWSRWPSNADDFPLTRINPLPPGGEVYMVDSRITWMGRV